MDVGDLLPSERKLSEIYDVSRTTVRLALDNLESRGYISTQHGKGSFVVDYHKTLINLSDMYSFTDQMETIGKKPNTTLLDFSVVSSTDELKQIFTNSESKLIKLVRLRSADDVPMLYEESYIPYSKFKNISADDLNKRAMYDIFSEDYDQTIKLAQEEYSASIASKEVAGYLHIDPNDPVLKIFRTTFNLKNEVIEYTESQARPDKFTYRTVHYNRMVR